MNSIITDVAKCTIHSKNVKLRKKRTKQKQNKRWYNDECRYLKTQLAISKQNLARSPNNKEALQRFLSNKKKYKSSLKKAEKSYRLEMTNKLLNLESNNPKEFWNMIQEMRNWGNKKNDPADNIEPTKSTKLDLGKEREPLIIYLL